MLETLPGVLEEIDNGNLSIEIPDHHTFESELGKQKQMVFKNKDTGFKVKVSLLPKK